MWVIRVLLLIAAGLALADASVVTLALPPVIAELDASIEQAAAVLGVYTLVLALALPLVVRLPARTPHMKSPPSWCSTIVCSDSTGSTASIARSSLRSGSSSVAASRPPAARTCKCILVSKRCANGTWPNGR